MTSQAKLYTACVQKLTYNCNVQQKLTPGSYVH